MHHIVEGNLIATDLRVGIVVARWNHLICDRLVEGALDTLVRHGVARDAITVAYVPGCFEVPYAVQKMAGKGSFDVVIALGVLIRGATPHFDYIASEVTKGIAQVGLQTGVPCTYGIITADTIEQAIERAGTKAGNKGAEAALAAIEMANLFTQLG